MRAFIPAAFFGSVLCALAMAMPIAISFPAPPSAVAEHRPNQLTLVAAPAPAQPVDPSTTDQEITNAVYRELWKHSADLDLTSVNVVAVGGYVKLQGYAASVRQKRLIMHLATEVVGRGNVTDELHVRPHPGIPSPS
jgi:osmotically-inducible protein OsmY